MVDAHVRRRVQVDPNRSVREQFGLHQLGLDRAEAWRHGGGAGAGRLCRFAGGQRREHPGAAHVRQHDVHLAVGQTAGRGHARIRRLSQRRPQFVLGVLGSHHTGANRGFQSLRRLDGEPFSRSNSLLGVMERAGHRILESLGKCRAIRKSAGAVYSDGARNRPQVQSNLWRAGGSFERIYAEGARYLQVRVRD